MRLSSEIKTTGIIKFFRIFASVYSIIISSVGILYYSNILLFDLHTINYSELLLFYILICMLLLLLVSNIGLLIKRTFLVFSMKYSILIYALQVFHFKLFELNYDFSIGLKTALYFIINDGFFVEFNLSTFEIDFKIIYPAYHNGIFIGINFIPIIIIGMYLFLYKNNVFIKEVT